MPHFLQIICVFLCLSFNLTFPMHRNSKWIPLESRYVTNFKVCKKDNNPNHPSYRPKKMATNIEDIVKNIKDTSQGDSKHFPLHINMHDDKDASNKLNDMTNYEQLVFMKKYPYLDLKEFEMKYRPSSNKIVRESVEFESGTNFRGDSSLCEPLEDGPNVEISNRGLSGFNIPVRKTNGAEVLTNEKLKQDAILKASN